MPRIARSKSQSCFKHVIVQGLNKEFIFEKEYYIRKYKEIILDKLNNSEITILAYCIMNNHVHFLIFSEKNECLSKYMQKINVSYSKFYNLINKRVGYVFRDRFFSQDILDSKQLYSCMKYIHNNPVKAKMVKLMSEYKYSSYNEFLGNKEIINDDAIKLLFGTLDEYKEKFILIHNLNIKEEEEKFIDIKEKDISDFLKEINEKYKKDILQICGNKKFLKDVIKKAKLETDVTLDELSKIFNIPKSTLWGYLKE